MNPFAQLIAPAAFTARRKPVTGAVVLVREGVRLDAPGPGNGRKLPGKLANLPTLDEQERAEAAALKRKLARERELRWYRERYARQKLDPDYMARRREIDRLRHQDPLQLRRIKKWERDNAERLRAYKTQWAQMKRASETPEQREARRAAQREKERAYYAANREAILAKGKARRAAKRAALLGEGV